MAFALAGVLHILLRGDWPALLRLQINPGDAWVAGGGAVLDGVLAAAARVAVGLRSAGAAHADRRSAGIVVLVPFTLWEALAWLAHRMSWRSLALIVAAALLPGAGAYGAYSIMQRELGAARVGVVMYLGPLYSAVLAWLVLGEQIEGFHLVGGALILPGIYLSTRP